MNTGKTLLLAAVLAAAPFVISPASAQKPPTNANGDSMQPRDRATIDRDMTGQRDMRDRDRHMRDRDRDMRDRDHREMRHYGWRRGHHYGWRHCWNRWYHHRRVRICR